MPTKSVEGFKYWAPQVDTYFQSRGLPAGLGPTVLGTENGYVGVTPSITPGKYADGLLQQSNGFMKQWNPGGQVANPQDQMVAAANFYSNKLAQGYTPQDAYMLYQQGDAGGRDLLAAAQSNPDGFAMNTIGKYYNDGGYAAIAGNYPGVDPSTVTNQQMVDHVRTQYNNGAKFSENAGTAGLPGAQPAAYTPPDVKAAGYTYSGIDEQSGLPFYTKTEQVNGQDREVSLQYDGGKWYKYDTETGDPIKVVDGKQVTVDQNSDEGKALVEEGSYKDPNGGENAPTVSQATEADLKEPPAASGPSGPAGAAGAAGGASAAAAGGMNIGGAGCVGGGLSAAGLGAAGGLMGQLGGIAQNAAMAGALSVLSGGGIQGALGAVLGSAGGALGSALGAAAGSAAGFAAGSIGATISSGIGQALGGALGGIIAGQNPLQALSGAAFGALSQMGGALMPGLSGVMPPEIAAGAMQGLQAGLGALAKGAPPSAAFQMALAGGLGGTLSSYVNNMTGNFALGATLGAAATGALNGTLAGFSKNAQVSGQINLLQFASNISTVSAVASGNRLMVGAITEAMATGFGSSTTGGLGAKTRNMQDAMTFSITTLGQNLGPVAADFQDLGAWDATNLMRFMQPGHVAAQILIAGLGDYTGLQTALVNAGVPLAGVDNPLFDRLTQTVLSGINDPEICNTVRAAFAMIREFDNLGELTSLQKMMPNSYKTMPVNNFRELGIQLSIIGVSGSVGQALTCRIIGDAIAKIEVSTDLNHIQQLNDPLPPEVGNKLLDIYGYGGGSLGEQTMADFIGTAAGYVHTDTIPVIVKTSDAIGAHVSATRYVALLELLKDALGGKYTTLDVVGDPNASPPIPDQAGYISIPFPAPTFENVAYNSLDEVIFAFVPLLEAELQKIIDASATDPALANNIKQLSTAWNASCAQIVREANNLKIHNIDLFNTMPASPQMGMMFTQMLDYWGLQTGYGQAGHYIERVASNDFYGDCVKYCMRQARNANALEGLGIDTEQYKLPQSKFLRDPEGFYQELYTGNLPATPSNRKAMRFPHDLNSVYIEGREKMLHEMGYGNTPLQNNQKDELYYDAHWVEVNTNILEDMGRNAVKTMLDRNILVSGNDLLIVDLDGNTTKFASIEDNGLLLTDNEMLVSTMLEIVNKLLYGNIQTTKYTNPFNTDQMIYGVLELLAQVTNQNVEALMQTITGGLIANGLLEKIMTQFQTSRSLYDTRMNRNDPSAYGGVGSNTVKIN
jgi:hypothetical protein